MKAKKSKVPQKQPGHEFRMKPKPEFDKPEIIGSNKLLNKVAIITGGDSGIGRAVAIAYAKEGADIVIVYLKEHKDAKITQDEVLKRGRKCLLIDGDLGNEAFCKKVVKDVIKAFGNIDILVNNAAEQHRRKKIEEISADQLEKTFRTNIFAYFYLTQAAMPHLKKGSSIINTTSVTAYRGSPELLDYSSTKGAIVAFTRSLSKNLAKKGIRVNGVAPGPIWTPLIVSTFDRKKIATFGEDTPMGRAGEPAEVAPCYVFLASSESSYMTGQILHPNGGDIINA